MKFEIIIGKTYNADFQVVSDDGVTPEVLDPTDTATFTISTNGDTNTKVIDAIPMTISDADNGLFNIELTEEQTAFLAQKIGFGEDNYPTISNYIGLVDFTLASGNRHATIDIYARGI